MKQHSRKKAAKIILIALFCIIIFFMIFLVCLIHNASTYVEKKYNKDFKIISIKLPYYKDDSDFFDWPLLYRPGEFVPFAVNFKDTEKDFSVIYNKGEFYDDYQLEDIFEWSVDYLKTVDSNVIGIKINCGKLHDIVTKENIKDFLINDNDSFVIYYKVDSLEQYYTYSKNGFKYTNDNFDNINSQVLKKFEFINKDIENKGVYLTTSDLEFSRNSWESFASYYYDTKIGNITLEEKGKAIG